MNYQYIFLFCVILIIIFFQKKKENFLNIEEEKLEVIRNINEMYKKSDFKIKHLNITNELKCDNGITIDKTYIGKSDNYPNYAYLSHSDKKNDINSYSILQSASGSTFINSKSNNKGVGHISIRKNNGIDNGVITSGKGFFGPAFIGNGAHNNYACFSHKDRHNDGAGYSLIQHPNGHTHLNSKNNTINIRRDNNDTIGHLNCKYGHIKHIYSDTTETKKARPRIHCHYGNDVDMSNKIRDAKANRGDLVLSKFVHHYHDSGGFMTVGIANDGKNYLASTDGQHNNHGYAYKDAHGNHISNF